MSSLSIVILAAGQGKRMYSALPKVLHRIAGTPMLHKVLQKAKQLQPDQVIVVYGHGAEQVRQATPDETLIWAEQKEQLGTGHAVQMALPWLAQTGYTLILYADVPLTETCTLQTLCDQAIKSNGAALLTDTLDNPTGYGRVIRDETGAFLRIVEEKDCTVEERLQREINTGMMVLPNAFLHRRLSHLKNDNAQREYYLTDVLGQARQDGISVQTVAVAHYWEALGVNNKLQLAQLERIYQTQQAEHLLAAGVTLMDPARLDVRGTLQTGCDVLIDINCLFEGHVSLGDRVQIGAHCILKNVTVAEGSVIAPYSHLEEASIGANSKIGPYARLRPGAQLSDHVHVGNFVEIKNSSVGKGSKVNHLTYIGDAEVGSGVNIGAGSVTCNYDGINKYKTVIQDQVFVGSGTMMVAPVTLGEGATIGAGSVITHNAPAGQLTLARSKQGTVPAWKRPAKHKG